MSPFLIDSRHGKACLHLEVDEGDTNAEAQQVDHWPPIL